LKRIKEKPLNLKHKHISLIIKDETLNLHLDARTFITEKPIGYDESSKIPPRGSTFNSISKKPLKSIEKRVYSWKNLRLFVKKGKFVESYPEFQRFHKNNLLIWSSISQILKKIEALLEENQIRYADINAEKVYDLANLMKKVEKNELVACILNQEIVKSSMKLPTKKFKGLKAEEMAAKCVQTFWKALHFKREKKRKFLCIKMAKKIQRYWRIYKLYMKTKETIKENFKEFVDDYADLLKKFKKEWQDIKGIERVEIHLNSFSYSEDQRLTMENYLQRANSQIARIFACKDPLVEVIYITPIELDDEIINYYSKVKKTSNKIDYFHFIQVIQIGDLVNFKEKVHFLYPEGSKFLPYTFSTSKKLLFSPHALKQIKKIIGLKPAYIITGYPGENDLNLAKCLKIPCFCGNPTKAAAFSRKTSSRELFLQCELPIPPSSSNFKTEEEFLNELVILLYENPNITTWLFKINNEFNGRGIASFTLDTSRLLNGLKVSKIHKGLPDEMQEFHAIIKNVNLKAYF